MDFDFDHLDEIEEKASIVSRDEIEKTSSTVSQVSNDAKAPAAGPTSYRTEKKNGLTSSKDDMVGEVWEVIGGVDKGGIVVRRGAPLVSPEMPKRLTTGALVEVLEVEGDRLKYRRLTGEGPDVGWVSIHANGKEIMVKTTQEPPYVDRKPSSPKVGSPVKAASPKAPEPAKEPAKAPALAKAPEPTKVPEPAKTPEPVKAAAKPTVVQAKAPEPSKAPAPETSRPKSPAPEPPQPKAPEPIKVATPKVDVPEPSATQPSAAPRELSQVAEEKGGNSMKLAIIAGSVALVAVVVLGIVKSKKK